MAGPPPGSYMGEIAEVLAEEARQRHAVATGVDKVICRCEAAIRKLQEAASALLQEPGDAAEAICGHFFEVVPSGLDPPILGPAARLVDAVFNGTAPLAGAILVACDLVTETLARPGAGLLEAAISDLACLMCTSHTNAGKLFTNYAASLGFLPGFGTSPHWVSSRVLAGAQARMAIEYMTFAVGESLAAEAALRLCQCDWEERLPWDRMAAAGLTLQRAIKWVDQALVMLRGMRDTLEDLEIIASNAPGLIPLRGYLASFIAGPSSINSDSERAA